MTAQGVSSSMDMTSKYNLPAAIIYREKLKTISQVYYVYYIRHCETMTDPYLILNTLFHRFVTEFPF